MRSLGRFASGPPVGPDRRRARRAGAALALAAALLLLACGQQQPSAARSPEPGSAPVSVSIEVNRPGRPVPPRFLGLSFEAAAMSQIATYGERGNLVTLLRSLGPGLLRFGGVSADTRTAWTDRLTPRPAWASGTLNAGDLRGLAKLASRSGWRVLLTVGLAHYDPTAAAREAAAARAALGPWLAGIEVGNEPDAYGYHHLRPMPWTYARYDAEVRRYRRVIERAAPGIPLAGPGVSGSLVFESWGPGEAAGQRPALLTGHHYPLGCHQTPAPSIARLLSADTRRLESQSLHRYMSVSRASGIPFRLDEANSVSCGGKAGISDTFAASLWAVGYITQTMSAGVAGINLQGNPANCRGYSPVCAARPGRLAAGVLSAKPEWYALLLTSALIGERPLRCTISSAGRRNVIVRAFRGPNGRLHVVIVEDDPPGTAAASIVLRVGAGYRAATVLALAAPSPGARSGVTLGARAVASDGSWRVPSDLQRVAARGGLISLTVAPSSAALLTITR